jgi:hypothetical protein
MKTKIKAITWLIRKPYPVFLIILSLIIIGGCAGTEPPPTPTEVKDIHPGEAEILQSWQGDYPVARLDLLPENQREEAVGFISDAKTFKDLWKAFQPGEAVPEIDFNTNLILFVRNTQFYNRISIGKVNVTDGVAELLAMETRSARPIEEKVAISLVEIPRKGVNAIQIGDRKIPIKH